MIKRYNLITHAGGIVAFAGLISMTMFGLHYDYPLMPLVLLVGGFCGQFYGLVYSHGGGIWKRIATAIFVFLLGSFVGFYVWLYGLS